MANPGAKPNPNPSAEAIVRYGLTRRDRVMIARRHERSKLAELHERYDRAFVEQVIELCDIFLASHGTWEEKHGDLR